MLQVGNPQSVIELLKLRLWMLQAGIPRVAQDKATGSPHFRWQWLADNSLVRGSPKVVQKPDWGMGAYHLSLILFWWLGDHSQVFSLLSQLPLSEKVIPIDYPHTLQIIDILGRLFIYLVRLSILLNDNHEAILTVPRFHNPNASYNTTSISHILTGRPGLCKTDCSETFLEIIQEAG